ncbi:MAG: hypothetical protein KY432_11835 [Acidobacteria bacterium]|nr:hypothetical protein [Acidobacteriota bacterium]
MTSRKKATLVFSFYERKLTDWSAMSANDSRLIPVHNLNLLNDSLHLAQDVDMEIVRVIFDHSVDAEGWLEFLTDMPVGFRGDVLYISKKNQGFLSAVGRSDERVMYNLKGKDLDFYLEVCGITAREHVAIPFREQLVYANSPEAMAV